jgi:two-component system, OmpR family, sensor kinase
MRRGKLALRLYALGVLQVVLVMAAAIVVAILGLPPLPPRDPERQIALTAARLGPFLARPDDLSAEISELRRRGMSASVYDRQGSLVASNVDPPLALRPIGVDPPRGGAADEAGFPSEPAPELHPLPPGDRRSRFPDFPPRRTVTVALDDATAGGSPDVLVARFERPRPDIKVPLLTLAVGLLIVGLGALLTARWIVRPLDQLATAAHALGEGDLRARSGLSRADEVGEVGRAFDQMAVRVERLVHAEKELLANVSHELRTPLARIRVALDLAQEGDADAGREALARIEIDLGELESLLDDVFTTARLQMETGRSSPAAFALHCEVLSPKVVGQQAADRFRARHPERLLDFTAEDELTDVLVDPVLFRRAIDNLLENAHKYSPDSTRSIELGVRTRGARVEFAIRDQGMGIAADDLPHVFEPFFRAERSRSRGTGGVGLGLTLARRVVEAHGGTIDVTSHVGAGTTVRVGLPASEPESR